MLNHILPEMYGLIGASPECLAPDSRPSHSPEKHQAR